MSIRAVGVNNGTIPGISRFVMGRTRDIYYIGGSAVSYTHLDVYKRQEQVYLHMKSKKSLPYAKLIPVQ